MFRTFHLLVIASLVGAIANCASAQSNSHATAKESPITKVALQQQTQTQDDGKVSIKIDSIELRVAYADEPSERQLGLMYRRKICDDCGMLFKFDSVRTASIWMKNTYIPLDLAYITEDGEIIDIFALTPHDLTSIRSSEPVLYALEMNQGWFSKKDIRVGAKVEWLP